MSTGANSAQPGPSSPPTLVLISNNSGNLSANAGHAGGTLAASAQAAAGEATTTNYGISLNSVSATGVSTTGVSATGETVGNGLPNGVLADGGVALPRTEDGIRSLIETLSQSISALDDVKDYDLIRSIDDNMYTLWKELERKMQRHRQSEAKYQLEGMFRI